ncbi:hypothetical protein HMPREF1129_2377 [Actinomyces naeslundii str. Howell 279]|uniref:Uncharacterized protein n=1 Tax=Actinomyces naeslundii (strain ATCC 12104 / DSM 43013 / CCUG 2238 / JCM 8349 / NCTC 10301 / Howell 279) TaxID=1115803 RepID=J3JKN7_ACTNH|nr:hypothetical protein HMPREF1129_2377 [Actinomyces naeslundii str. Howell 279]
MFSLRESRVAREQGRSRPPAARGRAVVDAGRGRRAGRRARCRQDEA